VQLRHSFRIHPTAGQRQSLAKAFGCARTVYNDGLRMRQQAREQGLPYVSDADLSKRVITAAGRLRLPKIGDVPVRWSRTLPANHHRSRWSRTRPDGTSPAS
jgi:hypothetical protein